MSIAEGTALSSQPADAPNFGMLKLRIKAIQQLQPTRRLLASDRQLPWCLLTLRGNYMMAKFPKCLNYKTVCLIYLTEWNYQVYIIGTDNYQTNLTIENNISCELLLYMIILEKMYYIM